MDRLDGAEEIRIGSQAAIALPRPLSLAGLTLSLFAIAAAALLLCSAVAAVTIIVAVGLLGRDGATDLLQQLKFDLLLKERVGAAVVSLVYIGLAIATLGAAAWRGGRGWRDLVALRSIRPAWPVWRDVLGIAALTLAYIGLSTYAVEHVRDRSLLVSGPTDVLLFGTIVANLVILAPVAEELLFRGWLYTALRSRFSFWPSFLPTLIAFAAIHFDAEHPRVVQVLPLAVALGLLRERAGSIKPTIALHAVYNLVIISIRLAYT